jgi:hypothetical protein
MEQIDEIATIAEPESLVVNLNTDGIEETPAIEIPVANTVEVPATPSTAAASSSSTSNASNAASTLPSETGAGLQNIEALAQNIMEMQNLCRYFYETPRLL